MKTICLSKIKLSFLLILLLSFTVLNSIAFNNPQKVTLQTADVIITLDNDTSDDELEDIKSMLKENEITVAFSKVNRNVKGQLISIRIALSDNQGGQVVSEVSSNTPISKLTFGRKGGELFITQGDSAMGNFAFFNKPNMLFGFPSDSIFGNSLNHFNFNDFFGDTNDSTFFNGRHFDIQKLMEQMQRGFNHVTPNHSGKYKFIDNPNTEKLIIIDGKESNFEKLNSLAETDKLADVEVLNPKIATSIYGEKAKDGAIIAITKK
ncbi:hypothetical protein [Snuella sedimenti]|uniref:TonB-dependent receptor plug domain-containing protein n=1 Tax=Snuella sedimenti TaxID=2798802 RepID=A0A8J7IR00_9FLAO|nr:hypothetical protein [Snuella sedimenti]MBJ6369582.1 hypothetical protein [Snuella sedimenti]